MIHLRLLVVVAQLQTVRCLTSGTLSHTTHHIALHATSIQLIIVHVHVDCWSALIANRIVLVLCSSRDLLLTHLITDHPIVVTLGHTESRL